MKNPFNFLFEKTKSGFEDDPNYIKPPCRHPQHDPPSMLVIPIGKRYRHICPGCGHTIILVSNQPLMW